MGVHGPLAVSSDWVPNWNKSGPGASCIKLAYAHVWCIKMYLTWECLGRHRNFWADVRMCGTSGRTPGPAHLSFINHNQREIDRTWTSHWPHLAYSLKWICRWTINAWIIPYFFKTKLPSHKRCTKNERYLITAAAFIRRRTVNCLNTQKIKHSQTVRSRFWQQRWRRENVSCLAACHKVLATKENRWSGKLSLGYLRPFLFFTCNTLRFN